jgi:hypothetical protein
MRIDSFSWVTYIAPLATTGALCSRDAFGTWKIHEGTSKRTWAIAILTVLARCAGDCHRWRCTHTSGRSPLAVTLYRLCAPPKSPEGKGSTQQFSSLAPNFVFTLLLSMNFSVHLPAEHRNQILKFCRAQCVIGLCSMSDSG